MRCMGHWQHSNAAGGSVGCGPEPETRLRILARSKKFPKSKIEIAGLDETSRVPGMRLREYDAKAVPARIEVQSGVWLDSRLGLWLAEQRLLVLADLHWGYAASHRHRGNLVPWWGDDQIEERVNSLLSDYQPAEMIWLGDVVHAAEGGARAESFIRSSNTTITLIAGNHDRRWGIARHRTATRGNFFFHHGDISHPVPEGQVEVIGHHHPAFGWGDGAGSRLKVPALVSSARRLILPAFSPWAAGTAWNSQLTSLETLWPITPTRILAVRPGTSAHGILP
jgi:uncharacterized protein